MTGCAVRWVRRSTRVSPHVGPSLRPFLGHHPSQGVSISVERATDQLEHGANLQLLGIDGDGDSRFMKEARKEVEAACRDAWALYTRAGTEKNDPVKILLLESVADASFVGLESKTVEAMLEEVDRLIGTGEVRITAAKRHPAKR
jgi:hypothetical protein